jgi:hypothetical protein
MKRRSIIVILLFTVFWMRASGFQASPPPLSVTDTVTPASWSLVIEANITGAHDSLASLGVRPDATPDYDPQYEIPRPPAPPGTSVQVYFPHDGGNWPTLLGNRFAVDRTDPRAPSWRFMVETNADNGPLTLTWDTAAIAPLPGSYFLLMRDSAADSLINIRESASYTFEYAEPRTFIVDVEFASSFIEIGSGWNILSLPRLVGDRSATTLFPGAVSPAYGFDSSYHPRDTLEIGNGYWLKFPSPSMAVLTGIGFDSLDVPVREGWNMVGALPATIPSPVSPMIVSQFYEYASGYRRADSLVPGKGYWVKAASDGVLSLRQSGMTPQASFSLEPGNVAATVTFRSDRGGTATLFLLPEGNARPAAAFDLPPVPPAPGFDARFASGGGAAAIPHPGGPPGGLDVLLQDDGGRVLISVDMGSMSCDLEVFTGPDQWEAITGKSEPVALSLGPGRNYIRFRLKPRSEPPPSFRLEGNYPNPFNPSTAIAYQLPEASLVTVTVTDPAGRSVFRGATSRQDAGRQEYHFDPSRLGLAAGVYFYLLDVETVADGTSFRGSGKLVYLK